MLIATVTRVSVVNFVSSVTILTPLTATTIFCEVSEGSRNYCVSHIIYFRNMWGSGRNCLSW